MQWSKHRNRTPAGFTLVEMLVVITIIGLLVAFLVSGMNSARESAMKARTIQTITKMHNQMLGRWEGYQLRRLPIDVVPPSNTVNAASLRSPAGKAPNPAWPPATRLAATRELMRYELPDSYSDLPGYPGSGFNNPSYLRIYGATTFIPPLAYTYAGQILSCNSGAPATQVHEGAECLYLILTIGADDYDATAQAFSLSDISDRDGDGAREVRDGWGNPIEFVRWPAGLTSDLQPMYSVPGNDKRALGAIPDPDAAGYFLTRDPVGNHDAFDPLVVDRWEPGCGIQERAYNLFPLLMSGGGNYQPAMSGTGIDEGWQVFTSPTLSSSKSDPFAGFNNGGQSLSDPWSIYPGPTPLNGTPNRRGSLVGPSGFDNIHNQSIGQR